MHFPQWKLSHFDFILSEICLHCISIGSSNGLVPSRLQAFTWQNVDEDLCRHMVSLGHKELRVRNDIKYQWKEFNTWRVNQIDWPVHMINDGIWAMLLVETSRIIIQFHQVPVIYLDKKYLPFHQWPILICSPSRVCFYKATSKFDTGLVNPVLTVWDH